jgi:hypothetical protein
MGLVRKDSELPHRADGKTSPPLPLVERTILDKILDVLPAKRLPGENSSLLLTLKVMPQTGNKEIFLVSEFAVQP